MAKTNRLPPWNNQALTLFHGTLYDDAKSIVLGINLAASKFLRDFGPGFYTTTSLVQAQQWAEKRCADAEQPAVPRIPAVVAFDVSRDDLAKFDSLWFVRGDQAATDYWSLVLHCRRGGTAHRPATGTVYDIVVGPVATVWFRARRLTLPDGDQVSFHTQSVVRALLDGKGQIIWTLP